MRIKDLGVNSVIELFNKILDENQAEIARKLYIREIQETIIKDIFDNCHGIDLIDKFNSWDDNKKYRVTNNDQLKRLNPKKLLNQLEVLMIFKHIPDTFKCTFKFLQSETSENAVHSNLNNNSLYGEENLGGLIGITCPLISWYFYEYKRHSKQEIDCSKELDECINRFSSTKPINKTLSDIEEVIATTKSTSSDSEKEVKVIKTEIKNNEKKPYFILIIISVSIVLIAIIIIVYENNKYNQLNSNTKLNNSVQDTTNNTIRQEFIINQSGSDAKNYNAPVEDNSTTVTISK